MKINIAKETYEPKWYEFEGCEFLINPSALGVSDITLNSQGQIVLSATERKKKFLEGLVDWKGVQDSTGADLPCTKEIKEMVFDFGLGGIADFVLAKNNEFVQELRESEKN